MKVWERLHWLQLETRQKEEKKDLPVKSSGWGGASKRMGHASERGRMGLCMCVGARRFADACEAGGAERTWTSR